MVAQRAPAIRSCSSAGTSSVDISKLKSLSPNTRLYSGEKHLSRDAALPARSSTSALMPFRLNGSPKAVDPGEDVRILQPGQARVSASDMAELAPSWPTCYISPKESRRSVRRTAGSRPGRRNGAESERKAASIRGRKILGQPGSQPRPPLFGRQFPENLDAHRDVQHVRSFMRTLSRSP